MSPCCVKVTISRLHWHNVDLMPCNCRDQISILGGFQSPAVTSVLADPIFSSKHLEMWTIDLIYTLHMHQCSQQPLLKQIQVYKIDMEEYTCFNQPMPSAEKLCHSDHVCHPVLCDPVSRVTVANSPGYWWPPLAPVCAGLCGRYLGPSGTARQCPTDTSPTASVQPVALCGQGKQWRVRKSTLVSSRHSSSVAKCLWTRAEPRCTCLAGCGLSPRLLWPFFWGYPSQNIYWKFVDSLFSPPLPKHPCKAIRVSLTACKKVKLSGFFPRACYESSKRTKYWAHMHKSESQIRLDLFLQEDPLFKTDNLFHISNQLGLTKLM